MLVLVLLLFFMLFASTRHVFVKGLCPALPGPHPVALLLPVPVLPGRQDHPMLLLVLLLFFMLFCLIISTRHVFVKGFCPALSGPILLLFYFLYQYFQVGTTTLLVFFV